jgi:hypothetical protein
MRDREGQYAAYCSLPLGDAKLYGQKRLTFRAPNYGVLETVPFAETEIGLFCTALALSDLLEELKLFDLGERHIITQRDEV